MNQRVVRGVGWWPLAGLLNSGCYGWVSVPPTELPKLDETAPRAPDQPRAGTWPVIRDVDGEPFEVIGSFTVSVKTASQSRKYASPIHCSVADEGLQLAGDGGSPQAFPLSEIERTEVYRYKSTTSTIAATVSIAATLAAIFFIGDRLVHAGP